MQITAIKQQVKRADRYSIYIDEKYICSFSEQELLNLGLRKGQELNAKELEALKQNSALDKGYGRALNLISHRMRSEWELRDYLKRKGYEAEAADLIIERLTSRGYVDDATFARRWVENRHLLKPTSKRKLQQELQAKRIATDIINQVFADDETDELEVLRQLVERKRARYPDKLKFMQYLARQGYGYDDIKSVLNESNN